MTVAIRTNLGRIELKADFPINKKMREKIRFAIEEAEFADATDLVKELQKGDPTIGTPQGAILAYMNSRGWTQNELSERSGITQPDISKMMRGKRAIGTHAAKKLGKAFGVDYRKFL